MFDKFEHCGDYTGRSNHTKIKSNRSLEDPLYEAGEIRAYSLQFKNPELLWSKCFLRIVLCPSKLQEVLLRMSANLQNCSARNHFS